MKCSECKFGIVSEHGILNCHCEIGNQGIVCLLKNVLRAQTYAAQVWLDYLKREEEK